MDIGEAAALLAGISAAVGLFLVYHQVKLLRRQTADDHERSRRETALDLIFKYTVSIQQEQAHSLSFVESLDDNQARKLYGKADFTVASGERELLRQCLGESADDFEWLDLDGPLIPINRAASVLIRANVIRYLNLVETIAAAWHYQIADRDMIEEQFGFLISEEKGRKFASKFRKATGGAYPCIDLFVAEVLEKSKTKANNSKGKLGH